MFHADAVSPSASPTSPPNVENGNGSKITCCNFLVLNATRFDETGHTALCHGLGNLLRSSPSLSENAKDLNCFFWQMSHLVAVPAIRP